MLEGDAGRGGRPDLEAGRWREAWRESHVITHGPGCGGCAKGGPQSNNGMHPTALPTALIFGNRSGAAGDAGRSAALWRNRDLKRLRAGYSQQEIVAGSERGVVKFPCCDGRCGSRVLRAPRYPAAGRGRTSACTRPATRGISNPFRDAGGRVMRGVRPLFWRRRELKVLGRVSRKKGLRVACGAW